jgi:ADP-L-glycero-D-manno-heptose 6-epimerase
VVPPGELLRWLDGRKLEAVIHLGAISDTTATDADLVLDVNFRLPLRLLDWCTTSRTPFLYASSAATYGAGDAGFDDDEAPAALDRLRPLNLYGWSKHLFDLAVTERAARRSRLPPQWAGLKFFNVFGPNEYHKGEMMSLVAKRFDDAKVGRPIRLFKSHRDGIADGDQRRDFVYVDDAVAVVRWLLETPTVCGLFNVGTGAARSFRDLVAAMFGALGRPPAIEYIDMPVAIRDRYQYFTQARVEKLRRAGYNGGFTPLEDAVRQYVGRFLDQPDRYR